MCPIGNGKLTDSYSPAHNGQGIIRNCVKYQLGPAVVPPIGHGQKVRNGEMGGWPEHLLECFHCNISSIGAGHLRIHMNKMSEQKQ